MEPPWGRAIQDVWILPNVFELLAESPDSWEAAAPKAVDDASKSLRSIASVYVKEFVAKVENNRVTSYRINAKVTFEVEKT